MRHLLGKLAAGSMIAGAALLVAACSGGDGEANNMADNGLGNADLGNLSDPSAVETLGNGTDTGTGGNAGTGTDTGTGNTGNTGTGTDTGTDTDGTDVGGDTGGNAAGGDVNGM